MMGEQTLSGAEGLKRIYSLYTTQERGQGKPWMGVKEGPGMPAVLPNKSTTNPECSSKEGHTQGVTVRCLLPSNLKTVARQAEMFLFCFSWT